jgi:hypothetical protein
MRICSPDDRFSAATAEVAAALAKAANVILAAKMIGTGRDSNDVR